MFYYEQATTAGRWTPVTAPVAPQINENGREKRADGVGKRIRPGSVVEVQPEHRAYNLASLTNFYGLNGKFRVSTVRRQ